MEGRSGVQSTAMFVAGGGGWLDMTPRRLYSSPGRASKACEVAPDERPSPYPPPPHTEWNPAVLLCRGGAAGETLARRRECRFLATTLFSLCRGRPSFSRMPCTLNVLCDRGCSCPFRAARRVHLRMGTRPALALSTQPAFCVSSSPEHTESIPHGVIPPLPC